MAQQAACVLHSCWFSLSPKYHGGHVEVSPGVYWALVGLCHSWGTPNLGNPHSYKGATCPNMPNLCPRGKYYHTGQKTNLPSVPEGDNISIFQGCLFSRHPWKDSPEWKQSQVFAKKWENHGKIVSPKVSHPILAPPLEEGGSHSLPVYSSCSRHGINSMFCFLQTFHFDSQKSVWKSEKFLLAIFITAITIPLHLKVMWMPLTHQGTHHLQQSGEKKSRKIPISRPVATFWPVKKKNQKNKTVTSSRCSTAEKMFSHPLLPAANLCNVNLYHHNCYSHIPGSQ